MYQDRLLYFPDRANVADVVSERLAAWPTPDEFRGLVAMPSGPARATVVVFHGNAGHAGHRAYYAVVLTEFGLRVILAEYPGYGPRDGRLGEESLVDDAEQTIVRAYREYGSPLLLVGESLGAAVAAAAAARQRDKVDGLVLITPWDRLASVATYHFPWLPVRWLLRDRYDSVAHLAAFARPVVVAVAEQDGTVPARFGVALYESLQTRKQLRIVSGADHNDWRERVGLDWWREALEFALPTRGDQTKGNISKPLPAGRT
jgi:hypothetical protein